MTTTGRAKIEIVEQSGHLLTASLNIQNSGPPRIVIGRGLPLCTICGVIVLEISTVPTLLLYSMKGSLHCKTDKAPL